MGREEAPQSQGRGDFRVLGTELMEVLPITVSTVFPHLTVTLRFAGSLLSD